ncbi:unnamed protein product [Cuscuta epithymum]|uniref:Cyclin-B3-1 n=1 Tax=Cuscuta epithymum TaxID=186058 RepID=A0AAV0G6T9_9ASTE|nr:unnamed protein product [Cuscuta epithymum]
MVAVKGKSNSTVNLVVQDPKLGSGVAGRLGSFSIYSDVKKAKAGDRISLCTDFKKSAQPDSRTVLQNITTFKRNMEKSKSKHGSGVKVGTTILADISNTKYNFSARNKAGRKVLADITNTKRSISRTELHDGTTQKKSNGKKLPYLPRSSIHTGTAIANTSSRKALMTNRGAGSAEASGKHYMFMRANQALKAIAADDPRAKTKRSITASIGNRKSVPALKRVNGVDTFDVKKGHSPMSFTTRRWRSLPALKESNARHTNISKKENANFLENRIPKNGFRAKPRVGQNSLPQGAAKSSVKRLRKHGFPVSAKPKVGQSTLPQPILKTTSWIAARSKGTHCQSSSRSQSFISFQQKEYIATSSLSEQSVPISSKQPSEEIPSAKSQDLSSCQPDILVKRASVRRKSFTSLLVTRPMQCKEQTKHVRQESLPQIYDNSNHLDVSEYVDDIYQYYWVMEVQRHPLKCCVKFQTEITPHMRGVLINWLIEVHVKFDLMQETLYLMVTVLDQYLSQVCIKKNELQLVGLTALLLASKYEDFWHPKIVDLISVSAESYTREQMLRMEKEVLKKIMFRLNVPTPYVFMLRFLKASQTDKKFEHLAFFLVELCLVEYEALNYKPSMICASAIYVARCTLRMAPAWTPMLESHARYQESQLRDCAEMILRFHKAARTALLRVTFEKYMRSEYSSVAAIRPLGKLPQ